MKTFLFLILSFVVINAFAGNPQRRICFHSGGYFWALDISEPQEDRVAFCRYEKALIGSMSLIHYKHYKDEMPKPMSIQAFQDTKNRVYSSCEAAHAQPIVGSDSEGIAWPLCLFEDGSYISEMSLIEGYNSLENTSLVKAIEEPLSE